MGWPEVVLFVAEIPPQIRRLKGGRMHITVGGTLMLLVLVVVWVFAAAVSNDPGCLNIENSVAMWGPSKVFMKLFLLCWWV